MKTAMILLAGEQPAPNLLPTRWLEPDAAVLVYTNRTQQVAENLRDLLEADLNCLLCPVPPYNILEIHGEVRRFLSENLPEHTFTFNLTGGTKPMVLAAFSLARLYEAPFVYFQTEGNCSQLYHYVFTEDGIRLEKVDDLPDLITIDDYLRAFVSDYQLTGFAKEEAGGLFERAIYEALEPIMDEIYAGVRLMGALEIDLVVRCGNQVGIVEAKTGSGVKKGIDQLNTAGGREYLGTYTRKMLVSDQSWDHTRSNLKELAEARRIEVIELPSYAASRQISTDDVEHLRRAVCKQLGQEMTP
jgi:hypothetical protein